MFKIGERKKICISYAQLVIVLIGLISSFWTYILHIQLKSQNGVPLVCDVNEIINCSKIIGSTQGEFFGIPLGIWGMIYWHIALSFVFLSSYAKLNFVVISSLRLVLATVGFCASLALIYISYFVLEGICEFCSVVQISCIIYFISSYVSFQKIKIFSLRVTRQSDLIKISISLLISFLIPLVLFFSTNGHLADFFKRSAPTAMKNIDLKESQNSILLPLLDNEDIDYSWGRDGAPVELIEFTDFECPYCQLLHEKIGELRALIDDGVIKIYFRNWPLRYHQHAIKLAIAARCAGRQGKFWEFADWSFNTAKEFSNRPDKKDQKFSFNGLSQIAKSFNLNVQDFESCLNDPSIVKKINRDSDAAQTLGGEGTPFLIINGTPYNGNWLRSGQLREDILKLKSR